MITHKLRINGSEIETNNCKDIVDSYTGEVFARVCLAGEKEYEQAIVSSQKAFQVTKKQTTATRAQILNRIAQILSSKKEEVARVLSKETGKPILLARIETERAVSTFEIAAALALTREGQVLEGDVYKAGEGRTIIVKRFPIGIVGAITPYNWPLNLVAHKLAPAFAVGNTVVLRPASSTPLTEIILADICKEAGLPNGQLNVIPSSISIAEKLVTDDRVVMISFTGSPEVGWGIKEKCGRKKVSLELGGNAAVIVEPDADLEKVVPRILLGSFSYAGQVCISVQRIFVNRLVFHKFQQKLLNEISKMKLFNPMEEGVICGPLITEAEAKRVESWVKEAEKQGATILIGGMRDKNCYHPTVLTNTKPEMKVNALEIFGPVVTLEQYENFEDALKMVNNSIYGLQAGVYTNNIKNSFKAYDELQVGGVMINDYAQFRVDNLPYGGIKNSGFGREGVKYAMEEMTELKHLTINNS